MAFLLSNQGQFVDIPGSDAKSEGPICLYFDGHGGENQCWIWEDQKIISVLDPKLCLGVKKASEGAEIVLVPTPKQKCHFSSWMLSNKRITLFASQDLAITALKNKCVLQPLSPNNPAQTWTLTPTPTHDKAQPACSTHFNYQGLTKDDCSSNWELQCSIRVKESTDCTYFCVVGWSPGGYSGIQEITKGRRVAIFSMWDDGKGNGVEIVDHGPGVEVSRFGGEGEGLKSMMDFDWQENEEITFVVKGSLRSSRCLQFKETWECSCFIMTRGEEHFMASFRRSSRQKPLCPTGFYSFIEDWNRRCGAKGHEIRRKAEFIRPTFIDKDGSKRSLKKIRFTKVEHGLDAMAMDKATAQVVGPEAFELCTGGSENECLTKCENNTELEPH